MEFCTAINCMDGRTLAAARRVEVSFYHVPFQREADSHVPYVAMPEVRIVNVPTLGRVWRAGVTL